MRTLLWLLLASTLVWAVPLDKVVNPRQRDGTWVTDHAHLLSAGAVARLNQAITLLERGKGTEVAVVTIDDTDGRSPKEFAGALFNLWGIGKRQVDNGVLVLVVTGRHRVEIEVGKGLRAQLPDASCAQILAQSVVPRFQERNFEKGIEDGVGAVLAQLQPPAAPPPPTPHPPHRADRELLGVLTFFAILLTPLVLLVLAIRWVFQALVKKRPIDAPLRATSQWSAWMVGSPLLLVGFFVVGPSVAFAAPFVLYGVYRVVRYRPRKCPRCGARMKLLDEVADDAYLEPGQVSEEVAGSIDYDVHLCTGCDHTEVKGWSNWLSAMRACPACQRKTFKLLSDTVLSSPTTSSSGQGRRRLACMNCQHSLVEDYSIARLSETTSSSSDSSSSSSSSSYDSSSSSSFGGGSSDGGGSGSSW